MNTVTLLAQVHPLLTIAGEMAPDVMLSSIPPHPTLPALLQAGFLCFTPNCLIGANSTDCLFINGSSKLFEQPYCLGDESGLGFTCHEQYIIPPSNPSIPSDSPSIAPSDSSPSNSPQLSPVSQPASAPQPAAGPESRTPSAASSTTFSAYLVVAFIAIAIFGF